VGNVNLIEDRYRLHMTGGPARCTLLCGFPCQPLSSQGDLRGDKDDRAQPFFNALRLAWEQQMGAVILECAPLALEAPYIQEALQRFAWSMNQHPLVHRHVHTPGKPL
jgi:site-specific DNA-cytosine methylase